MLWLINHRAPIKLGARLRLRIRLPSNSSQFFAEASKEKRWTVVERVERGGSGVDVVKWWAVVERVEGGRWRIGGGGGPLWKGRRGQDRGWS
jgi:hypothetical protein